MCTWGAVYCWRGICVHGGQCTVGGVYVYMWGSVLLEGYMCTCGAVYCWRGICVHGGQCTVGGYMYKCTCGAVGGICVQVGICVHVGEHNCVVLAQFIWYLNSILGPRRI